jgi:hypothetical protein
VALVTTTLGMYFIQLRMVILMGIRVVRNFNQEIIQKNNKKLGVRNILLMCYDNESECQINGCLIDNFYAKAIASVISDNNFVQRIADNSTCDGNNSTATMIFSRKSV